MLYTVVTVTCLALLAIEALYVFLNVIFRSRAERVNFVRGFKNGKCAIVYIIALPIYWIGHSYAGKTPLDAFFDAIKSIVELVVLKYDRPSIELLMHDSFLYSVAVYICFALVGVNALLLTFSLISQHVWVGFNSLLRVLNGKGTVYLFGNNEQNKLIYDSETKRNRVIVSRLDKEECAHLYQENYLFADVPSDEVQLNRIFSLIRRFERECIVIINTGNDDGNIKLCREIVDRIDKTDTEERALLFRELKVFVFGDARFEGIYDDIVASSSGCITYVNKYRKIAVDFIDKYPLTQFMDQRHIDYNTSFVREGVDINVMLLGFGKANQQIFLTSVANNQFITASKNGDDPTIKQVNYYIMEKGEAKKNKNLNHSYYRYENEMADENPDDYLPLPDAPANEYIMNLDINSPEFYTSIRDISKNPNDANFIIIAFGSDLENIDMAQKLVEKRDEWKLDNLVIFVKANRWRKEDTFIANDKCYFIGNDREAVFNLDSIYGDRIEKLSHFRSAIHLIEYDVSANPDVTIDDEYFENFVVRAENEWYSRHSQNQRESNIYGSLSIRSKLHLMGLDYCPKGTEGITPLTSEEYFEIYAGGDRPKIADLPHVMGKPIFTYDLNFPNSRRRNMAVHEHLRWNSFMISKGFVPATVNEILTETVTDENGKVRFTDGKRFDIRRHGNLTTFDGLVTFRRMTAERDCVEERKKDKIKYDYQLLDDVWWLLDKCGYVIYKRSI